MTRLGAGQHRRGRRGEGTSVVVGGPDLDRRAEVAAAIEAGVRASSDLGVVRRIRWPHAAPGRGRPGPVRSFVRAAVSVLRGRVLVRRRQPPGGVLVIEGAWMDLLLHPHAHGVWPSVIRPGRLLALVAPRADVLVVVDGSAEPALRPGVESSDWAPWAWNHYGAWIAPHVVHEPRLADRGHEAIAAEVVERLRGASAPEALRWIRAPLARRGRDVRVTASAGAPAALSLFVPTTTTARVAQALNRRLVVRGIAPPTVPPVDGLDELCCRLGVRTDGLAAFSSPARGRITVAATSEGELRLVLKLGHPGDAGLVREAAALAAVRLDDRFVIPRVLWTGPWQDHHVVATAAIPHHGIAKVRVQDVVDLCVALQEAGPGGGPVTHGDITPWNLLATPLGLGVFDWEHARFEADPMHDLAHYVVQAGAVRGDFPSDVAASLVAEGSPGWQYLTRIGISPERAPELVRDYLGRPWARSEYARRVADDLSTAPPTLRR